MTTTKTFVYGFLVVILALAFTACDNGMGGKKDPDNDPDNDPVENTAPEDLSDAERWFAYVNDSSTASLDLSVNDEGVCAITVGGTAESHGNNWKTEAKYYYSAKKDTSYAFVFMAWTESGTRDLAFSCYDDVNSTLGTAGIRTFSIDDTQTIYRFYGPIYPLEDGVRTFEINCADKLGTFYVKMISITEYKVENLPVADRWSEENTTDDTTFAYSVDRNGMCTITVGGTANQTRWRTMAHYAYTATANTKYEYKFEAWTESGTRNLTVQYYNGSVSKEDDVHLLEVIPIDSTRQTYTINGDPITKGRICSVEFQCADQLGTFYVKMISLKPIP